MSTCYRYISICFKDQETMETFCEEEHHITETIKMNFIPDYHRKIRISIENIPIELQDTKIRNFLSDYVTLAGNTYYPGYRYQNINYITGTGVYKLYDRNKSA